MYLMCRKIYASLEAAPDGLPSNDSLKGAEPQVEVTEL